MNARVVLGVLALPLSVARLAWGVLVCWWTGRTPEGAYQDMVRLYCATNGWSNALIAYACASRRRWHRWLDGGVLGRMDPTRSGSIARNVTRDGYHVFEERLPEDMCARLLALARSAPCIPRGVDPAQGVPAVFDPRRRLAATYDFPQETLLASPDVQRLIADPSILSLAQAYLEAPPILDFVAMWWSAPHGPASVESAQLYHFDLDRVKIARWFIYLTDVTARSGPHCLIRGSHRPGAKPWRLLTRGYARIPDEDLLPHYPSQDVIEVTGRTGTIFMSDGMGFHKGKPVEEGERLVLELVFTHSLLGGRYRTVPLPREREPAFAALIANAPSVFAKYGPPA